MGPRKLSSTTHFQPVPSIVKSSLRKVKISNAKHKPYPICWPSLATDLIKSYFQKGLTEEAHKLFNEMSNRDVVIWTAMISGYTSCYQHNHAWTVFRKMLKNGDGDNIVSQNGQVRQVLELLVIHMKEVECAPNLNRLSHNQEDGT